MSLEHEPHTFLPITRYCRGFSLLLSTSTCRFSPKGPIDSPINAAQDRSESEGVLSPAIERKKKHEKKIEINRIFHINFVTMIVDRPFERLKSPKCLD